MCFVVCKQGISYVIWGCAPRRNKGHILGILGRKKTGKNALKKVFVRKNFQIFPGRSREMSKSAINDFHQDDRPFPVRKFWGKITYASAPNLKQEIVYIKFEIEILDIKSAIWVLKEKRIIANLNINQERTSNKVSIGQTVATSQKKSRYSLQLGSNQ